MSGRSKQPLACLPQDPLSPSPLLPPTKCATPLTEAPTHPSHPSPLQHNASLAHCSAGLPEDPAVPGSNFSQLGWQQLPRPECAAAGGGSRAGAAGCWCTQADWDNPLVGAGRRQGDRTFAFHFVSATRGWWGREGRRVKGRPRSSAAAWPRPGTRPHAQGPGTRQPPSPTDFQSSNLPSPARQGDGITYRLTGQIPDEWVGEYDSEPSPDLDCPQTPKAVDTNSGSSPKPFYPRKQPPGPYTLPAAWVERDGQPGWTSPPLDGSNQAYEYDYYGDKMVDSYPDDYGYTHTARWPVVASCSLICQGGCVRRTAGNWPNTLMSM